MDFNIPKMPIRPENANKGTFGKILNVAGSKYMPGAAYLSSISALKIGAGYIMLASNKDTLDTITKLAPEVVLCPLNALRYYTDSTDVISIGCGLSVTRTANKIFDNVINLRNKQPLIIDADGLNILSEADYILDKNVILTPHPKEASRLLQCDLNDILSNPQDAAVEISKKYNCITVLKLHNTIVTDSENIYVNQTGCSALAKAGSGDILCGMITGLVSQGMNLYDAAKLGVYLHGLTGDIAAKELTKYCVLASDLVSFIPYAVKQHLNDFI